MSQKPAGGTFPGTVMSRYVFCVKEPEVKHRLRDSRWRRSPASQSDPLTAKLLPGLAGTRKMCIDVK